MQILTLCCIMMDIKQRDCNKKKRVVIMLIKTVVDETFEGAKLYKSHCRADGSEDFQNIELKLAEIEYDDAFAETLSHKISEYYIHTVFTFDYESGSDAGDGRDDYYTEEDDQQINLNTCIIKNNQFFGTVCESFECQAFVLVDFPETIISHPKNYGGKNYHFYRNKRFKLVKKI